MSARSIRRRRRSDRVIPQRDSGKSRVADEMEGIRQTVKGAPPPTIAMTGYRTSSGSNSSYVHKVIHWITYM